MIYKNLNIKWLGHSGFKIIFNNKTIYIDPFKISSYEKADIIFITHSHYDHFSIEDLRKIVKRETRVFGPFDILGPLRQVSENNLEIVKVGSEVDLGDINFKVYPAYNINKPFHPKDENWLGYLIDFSGTKVYHAGDSDFISEMKGINTDLLLIPVSGKFTMTADEAVEAAYSIKPDLAIPMHYGSLIGDKNDAERFVNNCKEKGINAVIIEKE